MRIFLGVVIAVVLVIVCVLAFVYSGFYNVAALKPHTGLVAWILGETMENSVRVRAGKIKAPAEFGTIKTEGAQTAFKTVCATCHAGTGAIARGLNPRAPDLSEAATELSPSAIFWIVKNGIKMTGMPAFAPTYPDPDIWALAAVVKKLPAQS